MPTGWSNGIYLTLDITSSGQIVNRVVASPSGQTFTADIVSTGTPDVAYGSSGETILLDIVTTPIPESGEVLTMDIVSEGFKWGAQPDYVGHGTAASGTFTNVSIPYPSSLQLNDTLIIIAESYDAVSGAHQGFRTVGTAVLPNATRLTVMMKAHWYSGETSVSIYSGNHMVARMFALRGARSKPNYFGPAGVGQAMPPITTIVQQPAISPTSGAQFDQTTNRTTPAEIPRTRSRAVGTQTAISQTIRIPGTIATVEECMILLAAVHGLDDATSGVWSNQANPDLISILERFEDATTAGNGGGLMLATAFTKQAFPDPFEDSTVTLSRTIPPWAGAHVSIEPIIFPSNDNFANATEIVADLEEPGGLLRYESGTYNATTETSEVNTPAYINTCWWKFTALQRQIVRVWIKRLEPALYQTSEIFMFPLKGSAVNLLTPYATVTTDNATSFGSDDGRGMSESAHDLANTFSVDYPLRVQVTPDTPLYLQVGRSNYTFYGDLLYRVDVDIVPPPDNDDFDSAEPIDDNISGTSPFVLDQATGQPGWIPATGGVYYNNPESWGDVWYKIQPTADRKFGVKVNRDALDVTIDNTHLVGQVFRGTTLGSLEFLGQFHGAFANQESFHTGLDLVANETYYIVVFWFQVWEDDAIFEVPVGGILDWGFFTAPSNDDFADAEQLGNNDSGSTSVATLQGATSEGLPDGQSDVWYEFTPVTGGWYEFTFGQPVNNYLTIALEAYRGTSLGTLKLAGRSWLTYDNATAITLALRGGETYKLRLLRWYGTELPDFGTITWALLSGPPTNDDFIDRQVITGASGNEPFTQEGATSQEDEWPTYYWFDPTDASVWFEWTCPSTGCYFFEVDFMVDPLDGYWYHELAVYDDDPLDTVDHKICGNENGEPTSNTKVAFDATIGQTYYIQSTIYQQYAYVAPETAYVLPYNFELNWGSHTKATNHLFADAILLTGDSGTTTGDTYAITTDLEAGILADGYTLEEIAAKMFGYNLTYGYEWPVGRVTWFKYIPGFTGRYIWKWTIDNWYGNIWVNIFQGTNPATLTRVKVPVGFTENFGSSYLDPDDGEIYVGGYVSYGEEWMYTDLVEGETYYIAVAGFTWDGPNTNSPDYVHWTRADIYQSQWDLTYGFQPPENNTYGDVKNNQNNIGNLMRYVGYNYATQTPITVYSSQSEGSSGTGSTIGANAESGEPAHAGSAAVRSVWYRIVPSNTGRYRVWLEPTGADPIDVSRVALYLQASTVSGLAAALGSDAGTGSGDYADFTVNLTGGTVYMIAVDGDPGQFIIHWQKTSVLPPIITFVRQKIDPDTTTGSFDTP